MYMWCSPVLELNSVAMVCDFPKDTIFHKVGLSLKQTAQRSTEWSQLALSHFLQIPDMPSVGGHELFAVRVTK